MYIYTHINNICLYVSSSFSVSRFVPLTTPCYDMCCSAATTGEIATRPQMGVGAAGGGARAVCGLEFSTFRLGIQ